MIGYTNSTASKPMPGEYINVRLLTNQSSHSDLNGIAFTVEYEGQSKDYVWEGSEVTILIPADMEYTVKFNEVEGYKTPESVTYTAVAENARDIEALYQTELLMANVVYQEITHTGTINPTNGVYIQDTDGYCHTESEWDGSYTPNGIAVVTSNCRFVIALEDARTSYCQWGSYGTLVNGITTTTDEYTAKADYDGEAQTTTILNQLGNSSSTSDAPAAYYCRAYTFPNGKNGYLGAAGEWQAVLDNLATIRSALLKCGGMPMSEYYWTSTQYSADRSWVIDLMGSFLDNGNKNYSGNYVRAFAAI